MATTKKAAPKKATTSKTKAAPAKKTTATKVVKKAAPKAKTTSKRARVAKVDMRSFRIYAEPASFTSMRFTRQTFYWLVLALFIVFVQLWILQLQLEVVSIIEAQQAQAQTF